MNYWGLVVFVMLFCMTQSTQVLDLSCDHLCHNHDSQEISENGEFMCEQRDADDSMSDEFISAPKPKGVKANYYIHESEAGERSIAFNLTWYQTNNAITATDGSLGFAMRVSIDYIISDTLYFVVKKSPFARTNSTLQHFNRVQLSYTCFGLMNEGLDPDGIYIVALTSLPCNFSCFELVESDYIFVPGCKGNEELLNTRNCETEDFADLTKRPGDLREDASKLLTSDLHAATITMPDTASTYPTVMLVACILAVCGVLSVTAVVAMYFVRKKGFSTLRVPTSAKIHFLRWCVVLKRILIIAGNPAAANDPEIKKLCDVGMDVVCNLWSWAQIGNLGIIGWMQQQMEDADCIVILLSSLNVLPAEEPLLESYQSAMRMIRYRSTGQQLPLFAIRFTKFHTDPVPSFIPRSRVFRFPRERSNFFRRICAFQTQRFNSEQSLTSSI